MTIKESTGTGQLYKVLVGDESCHGGNYKWSLPTSEPGLWHEVEGPTRLCSYGFHLTSEPAKWWSKEARVFAVEAEDIGEENIEEAKVVVRKVRLVREVTDRAELETLRILTTGTHIVKDGQWAATDRATVTAFGSATVRAYDRATVTAFGSATVRAYDSATVTAYDSATVMAYGSTTVTAYGSTTVRAYGSTTVRAYGSTTVTAYGSTTVRAYDSATVRAYDSATVTAYDSATVTAYGSTTVVTYKTSYYNNNATIAVDDRAVHVDQRGDVPKISFAGGVKV